jgi:NADP-dependent 3-hydroxy acid dehydrogenase YdfG
VDGPARGGLWRKVAVVTGGGSGVGRAVAKAMARQGASVVVADFDTPRMDRTVGEVLKLGTSESALALAVDVRSDSSVRALVRDSVKAMGRVDIVINAAGVLLQGKLDRITSKDWSWMLETNLLGAVRTSTGFLAHMTGRGSGHIINAVSYGGLRPSDHPLRHRACGRCDINPRPCVEPSRQRCLRFAVLSWLRQPAHRPEHAVARGGSIPKRRPGRRGRR